MDVRQHAREGEIEEGAGSTGEKSGQANRIRYRLWAESCEVVEQDGPEAVVHLESGRRYGRSVTQFKEMGADTPFPTAQALSNSSSPFQFI